MSSLKEQPSHLILGQVLTWECELTTGSFLSNKEQNINLQLSAEPVQLPFRLAWSCTVAESLKHSLDILLCQGLCWVGLLKH